MPDLTSVRIRTAGVVGATLLVVCGVLWVRSAIGFSEERLLADAERAIQSADFASAEAACQQILDRHPSSLPALNLAAAAAAGADHKAAALNFQEQILTLIDPVKAGDYFKCGNLALELGRLSLAEGYFRRALDVAPNDADALRKLIFLLRIEGRNWDAWPYARQLFAAGIMDAEHLYLAASTELVWIAPWESQFLEFCRTAAPEDPVPLLGVVRSALLREERHPAVETLQRIVSARPDLIEAQARLGGALQQPPDWQAFVDWHRRLPSAADEHPDIWFVRGLCLREAGETEAAIRSFGEAVCRNPDHRGANYQLSQLLTLAGSRDLAAKFADRAARLARMEYLLREVQHTPTFYRELVSLMDALGHTREAAGWAKLVLGQSPQLLWARTELERLEKELRQDQSLAAANSTPCRDVDWSGYPLPDRDQWAAALARNKAAPPPVSDVQIKFDSVAAEAGISFRYDNGANPSSGRAYMFEFSGGGVAVIDYDGNGWPDLYLTQGGPWPHQGGGRAPRDRLYSNTGSGRFVDVTKASGLGDDRFSQGATVGDYDNDGFPDLYVANIGPNRFYRNNGDGTFTEVTDATDTAGNEWSLSCALADLNGDGHPDLYVVNYLAGDVFERACQDHGRPVQCPPTGFPAEQDRLYLNLGDGRFQDVTRDSGIELPDGKGMGLIVADFTQTRHLDVFVANDTTANFLFRNATTAAGAVPVFVEQGVLDGVAFNSFGAAQSSMGVAAGDVNDDGLLDLFVTNFIRESSNLYSQRSDHTFEDTAREAGLRPPLLNLMGWGAQMLDADLDGRLDLVVANGHLDDYSAGGVPYKMPTQCFRNLGDGRFGEVPGKTLGPYFQRRVLGRAVARLDWNRDGKEDFCVTHVNDPFALLSNSTTAVGNGLRLELRGVQSSRDAIGASVRVTAGDRTLVRQVTAGDGFEASNARPLIVGLGAAERADSVVVFWPAGGEQTFTDLSVEADWLLIEGKALPVRRPIP
jgi:tetratricopeptide (TPR) repeat protein